jgi:UTP--glucose-1-phosphate uridylyltransferase
MSITKAVFPVAGMGTRFLPATKANPKEMLPIVDKPLIQYAVEEAVAAGIKELIFVTSSAKRAIEDHFDSNFELESKLAEQGKDRLLSIVREILPKGVNCCYVRQRMPLGLGHAVLCAKEVVGNEAFAVLLADDLIDAPQGCLDQMLQAHNDNAQSSVIAVETITAQDSKKYGVVKVDAGETVAIKKVQDIVEKPEPSQAPSDWGVVGRYILTPKIFSLLEITQRGLGGEIQLTDAIAELLKFENVYAQRFDGKRYDCGSKLGYLDATLNFALKHPEVGEAFRKLLQKQAGVTV